MPILKKSILRMQQEGVLDGQLRIGTSRPGKNGGKAPVKLETWRLTSPSRHAIEAAAQKFNGTARQWASDRGPQWEVITPLPELPVQFGGDAPVLQSMTYFEKGICLRRCTGADDAVNEVSGQPCECNATGREVCKPETKLRVRLIDVPGIGWWRFTSRGIFVAAGFPARAEFLQEAADRGVYVPARLVLREMKLPGKNFPVVDIDIDVSVAQILSGEGVGTLREIVAGRQPLALGPGARPALESAAVPGDPGTQALATRTEAPAPSETREEVPPAEMAQRGATKALATADLPELRKIAAYADWQGLMDEYVTIDPDGPLTTLRDFLDERMESLTPAGAA